MAIVNCYVATERNFKSKCLIEGSVLHSRVHMGIGIVMKFLNITKSDVETCMYTSVQPFFITTDLDLN